MRKTLSLPAAVTLVLAFALVLSPRHAIAEYMMPDLVNVPVTRLVKNLELLANKDPKNVEVRFNLARAHAMAYAQRSSLLRSAGSGNRVLLSREGRARRRRPYRIGDLLVTPH